MPLLSSTQTNTANGVPLYVPSDGEGNAYVAGNIQVDGNAVVDGGVFIAGSTIMGDLVTQTQTSLNVLGVGSGVSVGNVLQLPPVIDGNSLRVANDVSVSHDVIVGNSVRVGHSVIFDEALTVLDPLSSIGFYTSGTVLCPSLPNGDVASVPLLETFINAPAPGVFSVSIWNSVLIGTILPVSQFTIVSPGAQANSGATFQLIDIYSSAGWAITFTGNAFPFSSGVINCQNTTGSTMDNISYSFTRT